uniref:UBX domain-containing protein 7-like n=1 Tax=Saccoglossus kowalevskii TaxID=10224 RepID=A0ABM0MTU6_SACKO
MASKSRGFKALVEQFSAITGASEEVGQQLLDVCNGNLEMAIGMHLEGGSEGPEVNDNVQDNNQASTSSVAVETPQDEENLAAGKPATKKKTLEDLFRPPIDIMHRGTFNTARETGQSHCKWLLVNVQNVQEFSCQQLNRDVWSNSVVKSIILEHFVFWQVYHDSDEGQKYIQFYEVSEYPYVAILDPRTGEKLAEWHRLDNINFCDLVTEFLAQHPIFDNEGLSPPKKRVDSIVDASEDSQLEAAIAASLAETTSPKMENKEKKKKLREVIIDSESEHSEDLSDLESETFHSINGSSSESECSDNETNSRGTSPRCSPVKKPQKNGNANCSIADKQDSLSIDINKMATRNNVNSPEKDKHNNHNNVEKCKDDKDDDKNIDNVIMSDNDSIVSYDEEEEDIVEENKDGEDDDDDDDGPKTNLMVRFPDGKRKQVSLSASAKLM